MDLGPGFGTWAWDLDLGLGFGLDLGLTINKHFESCQKLRKDGIGKLYRKYVVKLYPMILVVNLYILLMY